MRERCESCKVPWANHIGIQGTCQQLQEERMKLVYLTNALEGLQTYGTHGQFVLASHVSAVVSQHCGKAGT